METLKEMQARHHVEFNQLRKQCSHYDVEVIDRVVGFRHREILVKCKTCGEPLVLWCSEGVKGYVSFAKDHSKDTPPQ